MLAFKLLTKQWISGPLRAGLLLIPLLGNFMVMDRVATAAPTNIYVATNGSDSNSGSVALPLYTINKASAIAGPGTVVHVASGIYNGPITTGASGIANARIRYISDVASGARIVSSASDYVWNNTGNYVDIQGFDVTSSDARIGIANSSNVGYVRIVGNHVHHLTGAACNSNGGAGILQDYYYGATNSDTIGNIVDHIGPSSSCSTVQGIYHSMSGGMIQNNIVDQVSGWGIHFWHAATGATATNNLVFNNFTGGIVVGDGDAPGGTVANNFVVNNNIVVDNPTGIMEYEYSGDNAIGPNNTYVTNLVFRNGSNISLIKGVQSGTLNVDPQLVNYQKDGSGDYHLKAGSPAIGAGTSQGAPSTDLNGTTRPGGAVVDIGVYAYSGGSASQTYTIFPAGATPTVVSSGAGQAVELGVKFRSSVPGRVTAVRFYKSTGNTGTHTGSLWSSTGQLLARGTFSHETASGWQQLNFATPVSVAGNTTYLASYHTSTGNFAYDENYFGSRATTNGSLTALQDGTDGPNSVYTYASGSAFPTSSYLSTNYWVDLVFKTN